jgi:hypothetical protein
VDTGPYATAELAPYVQTAQLLRSLSLPAPELTGARDLAAILERCNAVYLSNGLESLRQLPAQSIDFTWSHAVLEHVRRSEFAATVRELRRVMSPGGRGSHQVDLQDHLGGGLNNLRLPSRWWEADWMARSGFYTNRLRFAQVMQIFRDEGLSVERVALDHFPSVPLQRSALAAEFGHLTDEELKIRAFHAVLCIPG